MAWAPAAGGAVGVDLAIDVSTPDGSQGNSSCNGPRLGQYFARVHDCGARCERYPFEDVRAFCAPMLAP